MNSKKQTYTWRSTQHHNTTKLDNSFACVYGLIKSTWYTDVEIGHVGYRGQKPDQSRADSAFSKPGLKLDQKFRSKATRYKIRKYLGHSVRRWVFAVALALHNNQDQENPGVNKDLEIRIPPVKIQVVKLPANSPALLRSHWSQIWLHPCRLPNSAINVYWALRSSWDLHHAI